MDFTEEQQKIINHPIDQHGRVLAGPGTGKSFTAVALVKKLHENSAIAPKVKFITFTRAATAEIAKKLHTTTLPVENPNTLHSFALSILMQNPGCAVFPFPLRIPSNYELNELITSDLAAKLNTDVKTINRLIAWLSAKWESLSDGPNIDISEQTKSQFTGLLETHRTIFGYTLLQEIPDLLRRALRDNNDLSGLNYDFIIVDEYQDLNACDLDVIKRIAAHNICILAIGDDDQSIYSKRCAEPAGIRRFLSDFSCNKDYQLTICHRFGKNILDWSQHVIAGDDTREIPKQLTAKDSSPDGLAKLLRFRSNESETRGVVELIKWLKNVRGIPYSEILVLFRTDYYGAFSKPIKENLAKQGIPVSTNSIDEILDNPNTVKTLSLLRLVEDENDSLAWWVLLHQERGIGPQLIDSVFQYSRRHNMIFGNALKSFVANDDGKKIRGRNEVTRLIEQVNAQLARIELPQEKMQKWGNWIIEKIKDELLPEITHEFTELLNKIDQIVDTDCSLGRYISQIYPLGKDIINSEVDGVRFMTMTSSKGLTVTATIMVGVDDDIIPRINSDFSEERRLLYVAMTRPTDFLFLTWSGQRRGPTARAGRTNVLQRRQPSRFLERGKIESENGENYVSSLLQNS